MDILGVLFFVYAEFRVWTDTALYILVIRFTAKQMGNKVKMKIKYKRRPDLSAKSNLEAVLRRLEQPNPFDEDQERISHDASSAE